MQLHSKSVRIESVCCVRNRRSATKDGMWNKKIISNGLARRFWGTSLVRGRVRIASAERERERGAKIGFDLILERWQRDELSQKYKCIQIESNRRQYADLFYLFSCAFARCSRQPSKVFWYFIIMTNLVLLIKKIPQLSLHITQQHAAMRVHWNLQWKNRYRNQNGVSWELNCYNFSVSVWCALCGN